MASVTTTVVTSTTMLFVSPHMIIEVIKSTVFFRAREVLLQCLASIPFTLWLGLHLMMHATKAPDRKPGMKNPPV